MDKFKNIPTPKQVQNAHWSAVGRDIRHHMWQHWKSKEYSELTDSERTVLDA